MLLTTRALLDPPPPPRFGEPSSPNASSPGAFTPLMRVGQLPFVTVILAGTLGNSKIAEFAEPRQGASALRTLAAWAPGIARSLALPPAHEAQPLPALLPRGDYLPEPALGDLRDGDWNAVFAPPVLPRAPRALAQAGSELWEIRPVAAPPSTTPRPARGAALR